jgi:hypothetical protein
MHPELMQALAREALRDHRRHAATRDRGQPRTPRSHALRRAVGYRLVVTGWRLLDPLIGPGVTAAGAPPARTAGPRPA